MKQLVEQQDRDLKQKAEDISNLTEQLAAFQVERSDSFGVPQKIKVYIVPNCILFM